MVQWCNHYQSQEKAPWWFTVQIVNKLTTYDSQHSISIFQHHVTTLLAQYHQGTCYYIFKIKGSLLLL